MPVHRVLVEEPEAAAGAFGRIEGKKHWVLHGEQGHRRVQHLPAFVRVLLCQCEQGSGGEELETTREQ